MQKLEIVILGAGYGGLATAVQLEKMLPAQKAAVTLVNKYDYHYQKTWLPENAAGTLRDDRARIPIRDVINTDRTRFIVDTVRCVKPEKKKVKMENADLTYDMLIIALGNKPATDSVPGLDQYAFTINDVHEARLLKEQLAYNFAMYHYEEEKNQGRLNIVVAGGGLSGVQYLGELANRLPELCEAYDIPKTMVQLILLEKTANVLPGFDAQMADYAMNSLESRGVEVITQANLQECKQDRIIYEKDGENVSIPTYTTIWAGGMRGHTAIANAELSHIYGRLDVGWDMRARNYSNVFALGDCAKINGGATDDRCPMTASTAVQQAEIVSRNVTNIVQGNEELTSYSPPQSGMMASLGSSDAIGDRDNNRRWYGWRAAMLKKMSDSHYLFKLGGLPLWLRKGKFHIFY